MTSKITTRYQIDNYMKELSQLFYAAFISKIGYPLLSKKWSHSACIKIVEIVLKKKGNETPSLVECFPTSKLNIYVMKPSADKKQSS